MIYRRVDDEFLDPVHFRADSLLGCPGLINAARAGNVTIANAVGNGVADDKLVYTYLPDLIRYYLDEEPMLPNVDTWRLGEPAHREEVLDRLDELVLKPVDGSGGKGIVIGPQRQPARARRAARARCWPTRAAWIAQPVVQLSTVPDADRRRHAAAARRPAAVRGQRRRRRLGAARRADPGRAAGGRADRELLAAAAAPRTPGCWPAPARRAVSATGTGRRAPAEVHAPPLDPALGDEPASQQQEQAATAAATPDGVAPC